MSSREHCAQLDDAAAYVLGALDDREAERYRQHLETCADCGREVARLQPVVDLLPTAAPPVRAPDSLRRRVMSVVEGEAQLLQAAGARADRPPVRARWRLRPIVGLATAAAMAAGLVIGALVIGSGGASVQRTPAMVASMPGASAELRQSDGQSELIVAAAQPPPPGRLYQVWVQRPGRPPAPTDALFGVDRRGRAHVSVPGGLRGAQAVMVTAEPPRGSDQPTSPAVIVVRLHPS